MSKVYRDSFGDVVDSEGEKPFSISTGVSTKKTISRHRSALCAEPQRVDHPAERSFVRPPRNSMLHRDVTSNLRTARAKSVSMSFGSFVDAGVAAFSDGMVCPSICALEARPPKVVKVVLSHWRHWPGSVGSGAPFWVVVLVLSIVAAIKMSHYTTGLSFVNGKHSSSTQIREDCKLAPLPGPTKGCGTQLDPREE
jgi:hypothetical protein